MSSPYFLIFLTLTCFAELAVASISAPKRLTAHSQTESVKKQPHSSLFTNRSSLPLFCRKAGKKFIRGSVNLVGDKSTLLTVRSLFQNPKTCKMRVHPKDCWVRDPGPKLQVSRIVSISPPISKGDCDDQIVELKLSKPVQNGVPFRRGSLKRTLAGMPIKVISGSVPEGSFVGAIAKAYSYKGKLRFFHTAESKERMGGSAIVSEKGSILLGVHANVVPDEAKPTECADELYCGSAFLISPN